MATRAQLRDWLGDTEATDEQLDRLITAATTIDARWSDPDDADTREEALSAAAQVILGDETLESIAGAWREARRVERDRMAALTGALIASDGSERELVSRTNVARMTVRKALGR